MSANSKNLRCKIANSRIFLTVEHRLKSIPYPAGPPQKNRNYGFKLLKGNINNIEKIHEAKGFPGIISALKAINAKGSPFFSVGCEKYIGPQQSGGYYASGYIEFAFNYDRMVNFPQAAELFRLFSKFCSHRGIPGNSTYNFELQPAQFVIEKTEGYTCCVWMMTLGHGSHAEAEGAYNNTARFLGEFADEITPPENAPEEIY